MTVRLISLFIFFLLTSNISGLQFGFLLNDNNGLKKKRFVAFGTIPYDTSILAKSEIHYHLTTIINSEFSRRVFEGIERQTFIVDQISLFAMKDGRSMLALKGELSKFLEYIKIQYKHQFKTAVFFPEPLLILAINEISLFKSPFEVDLDEPAFKNEDDNIYKEQFTRDISVSEQTENPLHSDANADDVNSSNSTGDDFETADFNADANYSKMLCCNYNECNIS